MKGKSIALLVLLILLLSLSVSCGSATNPPNKSTGQTEDVGPTENTEPTENIESTENLGEMTTESSTDAETESEETTEEDTTVSTQEATEESTEESTEEATSKAPVVEIRVPIEEIKEPLHTFSWGAESGQLGWTYLSISDEYVGPKDFAVENDVLYILDNVNARIVIMEDGQITEIKSEYVRGGSELICQNQMIAVTSITGDWVAIYRKDGTLVHMVDYSNVKNAPFIIDVIEIGETYVVWYEWETKALYRYDWGQDSGE
ncbi:MAG: hypothetical protein IJA58_05535, partial [Lachnospiraceae bacterium]|nr:hypothetical protein [Lachnospiraceae bacterium]